MGTATERAGSRQHESRLGAPDARTCVPGFDVALNPATIRVLLADADAGTRERLVAALQQRHGNAAVQRLIAGTDGLPVQRWRVGLPAATSDCARVVRYMDTHSPYRRGDGWAETRAHFRWGGQPQISEESGVFWGSVANPTVTPEVHVDMPEWTPTDPAMAAAWAAMYADLRAHEAEHEAIAARWEGILRANLAELNAQMPNRTEGAWRAAVQREWGNWLRSHQDDQDLIDPYTAILDCSGGEPTEESAGPEGPATESAAPEAERG